MRFLFSCMVIGALAACQNSPQEPTGEQPIEAKITVSQEIVNQANNTADRFYDWLKMENYAAVQAMLDSASVPDSTWVAALIADLQDKQTKLGLPGEFELLSLQEVQDPQRKIYAGSYLVSYSKGFKIEETLFFLQKEERFKILDYSYDTAH